MVDTISKNSGTNPEINDLNVSKTTLKSRGLSKEERKKLSYDQTSLRQKSKKLERLKKEKTDLKRTLKNPKGTKGTLSSTDKLKIKDRITDIDIELFDLKEAKKTLSKNIVLKRGKSMQAKKNILLRKKMARKLKLIAISEQNKLSFMNPKKAEPKSANEETKVVEVMSTEKDQPFNKEKWTSDTKTKVVEEVKSAELAMA